MTDDEGPTNGQRVETVKEGLETVRDISNEVVGMIRNNHSKKYLTDPVVVKLLTQLASLVSVLAKETEALQADLGKMLAEREDPPTIH